MFKEVKILAQCFIQEKNDILAPLTAFHFLLSFICMIKTLLDFSLSFKYLLSYFSSEIQINTNIFCCCHFDRIET